MRIAVCGGRRYDDRDMVYRTLDQIWHQQPIDTMIVIQGGATGADLLAREWCVDRRVEYVNVPALWESYGLQAGPLRNQKMISKYKPELVIAFPGDKGTADMVKRSKAAGIPVTEVERSPVTTREWAQK